MAKNKKYALVLSGGGFKGAFQVGALEYILDHGIPIDNGKIIKPDISIVAGVSVGALNGVMVSAGKFELLKNIWFEDLATRGRSIIFESDYIEDDGTINTKNIIDHVVGKVTIPKALGVLFKGLNSGLVKDIENRVNNLQSLGYNENLFKTLDEIVSRDDIVDVIFDCGFVCMEDGEYYSFRPDEYASNKDFLKSVVASTTMPVFWRPVQTINVLQDNIQQSLRHNIDGGLRDVTPLGSVIDQINELGEDDYEIIVITNGSGKINKYSPTRPNILSIAKRALLDIALDEIFDNDIKTFKLVNSLVLQADKQGVKLESPSGNTYRSFNCTFITPEGIDLGDTLDTRPSIITQRRTQGYQRAKEIFEGSKPVFA